MRINQNIAAFNSYRNLSMTNTVMGKSLEKLSSGFRINRAADDAAGLVISQGLRAQVSGLRQATRNAQDGISVVQTAEGALNEVHAMLNRMRDLAVQASNSGSNDVDARKAANAELTQLTTEINRISASTKFGKTNLLDGTFGATNAVAGADQTTDVTLSATAADRTFTVDFGGDLGPRDVVLDAGTYDADGFKAELSRALQASYNAAGGVGVSSIAVDLENDGTTWSVSLRGNHTFTTASGLDLAGVLGGATATSTSSGTGGVFQVGANEGDTISVAISSVSVTSLGLGGLDLENNAEAAMTTIDAAIAQVSSSRGDLGAVQNRFESTINNLQVTTENLAASESRIRDTDMALEMVSFTRHQILLQAGTAMLGQANQLPQSVLGLLR